MSRLQTLARMVVLAHGALAISHLFLAAKILPPPGNDVSWLAIVLITSGHLCVLLALWKLGEKLAGLVLLIFFLAALSADLYEHFLHRSANNVLMVAPGDWTVWFDASVFGLLVLEILACSLGIWMLGTRRNPQPAV